MKRLIVSLAAAGMLAGLYGPGTLQAQEISCSDLKWKPEVVRKFPDVVTGCREVIARDGRLFARFEARLVRARVTTGMVSVKILLPGGGEVVRSFHAPRQFEVTTANGGRFCIFELGRGELLDIYVSDRSFAVDKAPQQAQPAPSAII